MHTAFLLGAAVNRDKSREEIRPLLGYYVGCSGRKSFLGFGPFKKGPIGCPEIPARNFHSTLHNIPEEPKFHPRRGGSLKSETGEVDVRPGVMLKS
jgi:hypothetical protein